MSLDFVNNDNWTHYLSFIQYKYNTTPNRITSYAPFDIIHGHSPNNPINIEFDPSHPEDYRKYINARISMIKRNANKKQTKYDEIRKRYYDKNRNIDSFR